MSTGVLIQLSGKGIQNVYLDLAPQYTFFKRTFRRHTNYAVQAVTVQCNGTIGWAKNMEFTLSRNGDLLAETYFCAYLPCCGVDTSPNAYTKANRGVVTSTGVCGAVHGSIPTSVAQPTEYKANPIKHSELAEELTSAKHYSGLAFDGGAGHLQSHLPNSTTLLDRNPDVTGQKVVTPSIVSSLASTAKAAEFMSTDAHANVAWCNALGHAMIDNIMLKIGGQELSTMSGEYLHIHHQINNGAHDTKANENIFCFGEGTGAPAAMFGGSSSHAIVEVPDPFFSESSQYKFARYTLPIPKAAPEEPMHRDTGQAHLETAATGTVSGSQHAGKAATTAFVHEVKQDVYFRDQLLPTGDNQFTTDFASKAKLQRLGGVGYDRTHTQPTIVDGQMLTLEMFNKADLLTNVVMSNALNSGSKQGFVGPFGAVGDGEGAKGPGTVGSLYARLKGVEKSADNVDGDLATALTNSSKRYDALDSNNTSPVTYEVQIYDKEMNRQPTWFAKCVIKEGLHREFVTSGTYSTTTVAESLTKYHATDNMKPREQPIIMSPQSMNWCQGTFDAQLLMSVSDASCAGHPDHICFTVYSNVRGNGSLGHGATNAKWESTSTYGADPLSGIQEGAYVKLIKRYGDSSTGIAGIVEVGTSAWFATPRGAADNGSHGTVAIISRDPDAFVQLEEAATAANATAGQVLKGFNCYRNQRMSPIKVDGTAETVGATPAGGLKSFSTGTAGFHKAATTGNTWTGIPLVGDYAKAAGTILSLRSFWEASVAPQIAPLTSSKGLIEGADHASGHPSHVAGTEFDASEAIHTTDFVRSASGGMNWVSFVALCPQMVGGEGMRLPSHHPAGKKQLEATVDKYSSGKFAKPGLTDVYNAAAAPDRSTVASVAERARRTTVQANSRESYTRGHDSRFDVAPDIASYDEAADVHGNARYHWSDLAKGRAGRGMQAVRVANDYVTTSSYAAGTCSLNAGTKKAVRDGFSLRAHMSTSGNCDHPSGGGRCVKVMVPIPFFYSHHGNNVSESGRTQTLPVIALQYHDIKVTVKTRNVWDCVQTDYEARNVALRCTGHNGLNGCNLYATSGPEALHADHKAALKDHVAKSVLTEASTNGGFSTSTDRARRTFNGNQIAFGNQLAAYGAGRSGKPLSQLDYGQMAAYTGQMGRTDHGGFSHCFPGAAGTGGAKVASDSSPQDMIDAFLMIQTIFLDSNERRLFASNTHEYLIQQVQMADTFKVQPQTAPHFSPLTLSCKLNFNHPVSHMYWVAQRPESRETKNYFRYEATHMAGDDLLIKAELMLNSHGREEENTMDPMFLRNIQPQTHFNSGFNGGIGSTIADGAQGTGKNIYMYSFAQHPAEWWPSGNLNMSRIDNCELRMTLKGHANQGHYGHHYVYGGSGYHELADEIEFAAKAGELTDAQRMELYYGTFKKGVDIRVYCVNMNVGRCMSGMFAVKYAN